MYSIISFLFTIAIANGGCTPPQQTGAALPANDQVISTGRIFSYADGSGNSYRITKDSFEYVPVKPAASSTGQYDGGDPVKKATRPEQFSALSELIMSAYNTKEDHVTERGKGTGQVVITENGLSTMFILAMTATSRLAIESLLVKMKVSD